MACMADDDDDSPTIPCQCPSLSYGSLPSDMYLAAKNGDIKKVRQFIENGNDINAADSDGYTILSSACVGGQTAVVRFLQKQRYLHRNTKDWAGDTPLMHASMMGHTEVVKELVNCPHLCVLDLNARNSYEESALDVAVSAGYGDIEEFLRKAKLPKLMAPEDFEADRIPIKTKAQIMVKFECQVCLEEYDMEERRARTLSCGHSICTSCIAGIITSSHGGLPCPLCRAIHTGRATRATDVPVNFAIDGVIRELTS